MLPTLARAARDFLEELAEATGDRSTGETDHGRAEVIRALMATNRPSRGHCARDYIRRRSAATRLAWAAAT